MHAETRKRFDVIVPMVYRMNVLVEKSRMKQPMRKVEMDVSKVWQENANQQRLNEKRGVFET
jgi:hypothetical protein